MYVIWKTVGPILLLQIAIAFAFIVWPILSGALTALARWIAPRQSSSSETQAEAQSRTGRFHGKWREASYESQQRGSQQTHQRQEPPSRPTPQPSQRDIHLAVLGLPHTASAAQIKRAYRKQAKSFHPDRFASSAHSDADRSRAADKMRRVNEAYDWLSDRA